MRFAWNGEGAPGAAQGSTVVRRVERGKKAVYLMNRLKRKALVWGLLFLLSVCIYNALAFVGLFKLIPLSGNTAFHTPTSDVYKFLHDILANAALPLAPSSDPFDHHAVVVGPYGNKP